MPVTAQQVEFLPLAIYTFIAVALIFALLGAAYYLGSGKDSPDKGIPYESGIVPSGGARHASQVPFYLIAIFFIVFDVEGAFIYTWATAWDLLGIQGMVHITIFIVVLLLGLVWLWIKGGLDWGPTAMKRQAEVKVKVE
ncbi:NADH-quinone oxidoreductase subunit A 2 [Geomonas silvestris]|uniref:NADH-quinone oxidoreductase subunit A n=1 Tax=Geomonas silvestris TaxID=2740184 RepID=A0A6V8MGX6_9BACT|nr:NADH-quinone oxidoreductase subunit A [Geomonas silvestris]GFO58939.1 NADH-quinone oxidoreductase subunit A 2 [Geomonas silvestris]